ncbi:MAG: hypothetical protein QW244_03155 [Candidatus Pacearchaeota archaeon]
MKKVKRKHDVLIIALVLIIIIVILSTYFLLSRPVNCQDENCFLTNLKNCQKTKYSSEEWYFKIRGTQNEKCRVYVENIELKDAEADIVERLKGKSMECWIPLSEAGSYLPHENIDVCHGELKEEVLNLMIEKLHLYIVQQIGQIK